MNLKIAIQPDAVTHVNGERQSFSARWSELAHERGITVVPVDVYAHDALTRIRACDAFLWRPQGSAHERLYARRLLYAVEAGLGLPVYPALNDRWYFEDKLAQHHVFAALGIPTPATQIFWTREQATHFCDTAMYPFVLKLSGGIQAANVRLMHTRSEALFYVDQLFGAGLVSLGYRPASPPRRLLRRLRSASKIVRGQHPGSPTADAELQHGYFYAQEFVPDNACNIRVTVIGKRAFVFRMSNRPGDFRASLLDGSIDWNPQGVGEDAIRLAWRVARELDAQTVAADIIRRGSQPVLVELTLNFASWPVRDCPGHWLLEGTPDRGELTWSEGHMEPADAIFEDFLARIQTRRFDHDARRARTTSSAGQRRSPPIS